MFKITPETVACDAAPLQPTYLAEQVRRFDAMAIEQHGIAGYDLMCRAGAFAFSLLPQPEAGVSRLLVLCGGGNNGGDGYVVARLAHAAGWVVDVMAIKPIGVLAGDAARAAADAVGAGVNVDAPLSRLPTLLQTADWIVDALLGTGFRGALSGDLLDVVQQVNTAGRPVLALDTPSGLNVNTGYAEPGACIQAVMTATFVGNKRGLYTGAGRAFAGDVHYSNLGVPESVFASEPAAAGLLLADDEAWPPVCTPALRAWLGKRRADAHKGDYGHVVVVGGDVGFCGAPVLAAMAALRAGAGLVTVATRIGHHPNVVGAMPEIMTCDADDRERLLAALNKASVIVAGPGLGVGSWGVALLESVLSAGKPVVLDADALNLLAQGQWTLPPEVVMTPHPGEAARLNRCETKDIARDRFACVERLAKQYDATVVLKGGGTLVASPGRPLVINTTGNPGMASAGMGDVLSGIVGALLAQGLDAWRAAVLAVHVHGAAGDAAAAEGQRGLVATDLLPYVRLGLE